MNKLDHNDNMVFVIKLINLLILLTFIGFSPIAISQVESEPFSAKDSYVDSEFFEKNFVWSKTLKKYKLHLKPSKGLKNEVAFCFKPIGAKENQVKAINYKKPLRIASLSKLYTSMWALARRGADYSFKTNVFYDESSRDLYLWGYDPLFSIEHLLNIIHKLNNRGVTKLNKIIISDELTLVRKKEQFLRGYPIEKVSDDLSRGWKYSFFKRVMFTNHTYHEREKKNYLKFFPEDTLKFSKLSLKAKSITVEPKSYFKERDSLAWLEMNSQPLSSYLKIMNTVSYNTLADSLFEHLGGAKAFRAYFTRLDSQKSQNTWLYTGSGLNKDIDGKRYDNVSTCEAALFVMEQIDKLLSGESLKDILAYGGNREGTLKNRFKSTTSYKYQYLRPYVAAKTGTLNQKPTSAIAGVFGQKDEIEQIFTIITEYRPFYWRDKNKKLRKSYPNAKRFEEEILNSMQQSFDYSELDPPLEPIYSSLQEITETLSVIDK